MIHQCKSSTDRFSFAKFWEQFKNGFGDANSSYWLGNEKVYQLTTSGKWKLRVEVQSSMNLKWYSAEYTIFTLASEADMYRINVGGYTGDAGDGFNFSPFTQGVTTNMSFTTIDKIDYYLLYSYPLCPPNFEGWWWNVCGTSALTVTMGSSMWGTLEVTVGLANFQVKDNRMMIKQCD